MADNRIEFGLLSRMRCLPSDNAKHYDKSDRSSNTCDDT